MMSPLTTFCYFITISFHVVAGWFSIIYQRKHQNFGKKMSDTLAYTFHTNVFVVITF